MDMLENSSDMSYEFSYIFYRLAVEPLDHQFLAISIFSLITIQEPFLTPYTLNGQSYKILRFTIQFFTKNINAFLLTFSSMHISRISQEVSLQLLIDRRVVLLEPVQSAELMKIRILFPQLIMFCINILSSLCFKICFAFSNYYTKVDCIFFFSCFQSKERYFMLIYKFKR